MKHLLILPLLALLGACSLSAEERVAIGQGVSILAVSAVDQLQEIGQNPVAVSQQTHDLMAFGCGIVEQGEGLLGVIIDIIVARAAEDPEAQPVTGAEILGYVNAGCAVLDSLPIKQDDPPTEPV